MLHTPYVMRNGLQMRVNVYRLGILFEMRETIYIKEQDTKQ